MLVHVHEVLRRSVALVSYINKTRLLLFSVAEEYHDRKLEWIQHS